MALPLDVAPSRPVDFPDTGIGRGWEPTAVLVIALLILSFGLVTVYSASSVLAQRQSLPDHHYVLRQAGGALAGLGALVVCARVPVGWWRALAWPMVVVSAVALLVLVLPGTEPIAPEINGARRWLRVGITVQPSEVAKVTVVLWTAALVVKKQPRMRSLRRGLLPFLVMWGLLAGLVAAEPDLSAAILLVAVGMTVVFAGGGRIGHFVFLALVAAPILWTQVDDGYRARRISALLDSGANLTGARHQLHQSLIAVGSGGATGVGFGEGRQKFGFLPEPHNDFIFAMIGEEWGFVGVFVVVALFTALILVGFRIARRAPTLFGELVAQGITSLIALQAVLHMGVTLGFVPPTGIPLPLVSYGRSSLVMTMAALGILVAIARGGRDTPAAAVGGARG